MIVIHKQDFLSRLVLFFSFLIVVVIQPLGATEFGQELEGLSDHRAFQMSVGELTLTSWNCLGAGCLNGFPTCQYEHTDKFDLKGLISGDDSRSRAEREALEDESVREEYSYAKMAGRETQENAKQRIAKVKDHILKVLDINSKKKSIFLLQEIDDQNRRKKRLKKYSVPTITELEQHLSDTGSSYCINSSETRGEKFYLAVIYGENFYSQTSASVTLSRLDSLLTNNGSNLQKGRYLAVTLAEQGNTENNLLVVNVHLDAGITSERIKQAIIGIIAEVGNVFNTIIIGGDFNQSLLTEEEKLKQIGCTLECNTQGTLTQNIFGASKMKTTDAIIVWSRPKGPLSS